MNELSAFEQEILEAISRGNGKWTWYEIAKHIAGLYPSEERNLHPTLLRLSELGLITKYRIEGFPRDSFKLNDEEAG